MIIKRLIYSSIVHNLYAILAKILDICKTFSTDLVNEKGNIPCRGVVLRFSDLEVISLNLAAESIGLDSKSFLFSKLNEYKNDLPSLISEGLFTRIIGKISALTIFQYINKINNKPIGKIKYALI